MREFVRSGLHHTLVGAAICVSMMASGSACADAGPSGAQVSLSEQALARQVHVGDVVFIRVPAYPFAKIAAATGTWTNHVGIVIDISGTDPLIAESKVPLSTATPLSRFVARSEVGRVQVSRLNVPLSDTQRAAIAAAARERFDILYDTGFNLHSHREFCSRYVREVLDEATGVEVGEVETFSAMLKRNPTAEIGFWRIWYFGRIPWSRETVTPASILRSDKLHTVFDGRVVLT